MRGECDRQLVKFSKACERVGMPDDKATQAIFIVWATKNRLEAATDSVILTTRVLELVFKRVASGGHLSLGSILFPKTLETLS